jgi:hypothetical protein
MLFVAWNAQEQDVVRHENKSKSKTKHEMHVAVVNILYSDTLKALVIVENYGSSIVSNSSLVLEKQFLHGHVSQKKNFHATKQLFINACAAITWEEIYFWWM